MLNGELIFGMCIIGYPPTYCINFEKFKLVIIFLTKVQKRVLMYYNLWSQIISILVSKQYLWGNFKHLIIIVIFAYLLKYLQIQNSINI